MSASATQGGHNKSSAVAESPSNRLATIYQRNVTNRQDRQRSDSIGRTVLQTVAPKLGELGQFLVFFETVSFA